MAECRGSVEERGSPTGRQPRVINTHMDCCLLQLYEQGRWADSVIKVKASSGGLHSVAVHKLILAARSPVFEGIFYGPLAHTDDVILEQFDYNTMDLLLRCVYGGPHTLIDAQRSNLPDETSVQMLLEISHYFQVAEIVDWCEEALGNTLTVSNACELLDVAFMYGLEKLKDAAIAFIDAKAKYIVKTDSFFNVSEQSLKYIFSGETFYLSKAQIHDVIKHWQAKQNNKFKITDKGDLDGSGCECIDTISADIEDILSVNRVKPYEKISLAISTEPGKTAEKSCVYLVSVANDVILDSVQFSDLGLLLDWGSNISSFLTEGLPVRVIVSCEKIKYSFIEETRFGELKNLKMLPLYLPSSPDEYEIKVSLEFYTADCPILIEAPVYNGSVSVCSKGNDVRVRYKGDDYSTLDSPDSYIDQPIYWIGPGVSHAFDESTTATPALIQSFTFKRSNGRCSIRKRTAPK